MMFNLVEIGKACAKSLLIVVNGLFILVAFFAFGFAVIDMRILNQYGAKYAAGSVASDIVIILVSLLLVLVAILGLVGAARSNVKMLFLYVGFLMILMVLQLLVAIYVALQRYGLEFRLTEWMREDFFSNVTGDALEQHNMIWDELQTYYECCGLNGPEDYLAIQQKISLSCCPRAYRARTTYAQQQLYKTCIDSTSYYNEGCEDEILHALRESANCLLGVAFMCFWFEAAGMLLAMWVANTCKQNHQVYQNSPTAKY